MSILSEINLLWAASTSLNSLLPSTKVATGRVPKLGKDGMTMPYASLEIPDKDKDERTSTSRIYATTFKVTVWAATEAQVKGISLAVEDTLSDLDFDGGTEGYVSDVNHESTAITQPDDDPTNRYWQSVIQFRLQVVRARTH